MFLVRKEKRFLRLDHVLENSRISILVSPLLTKGSESDPCWDLTFPYEWLFVVAVLTLINVYYVIKILLLFSFQCGIRDHQQKMYHFFLVVVGFKIT